MLLFEVCETAKASSAAKRRSSRLRSLPHTLFSSHATFLPGPCLQERDHFQYSLRATTSLTTSYISRVCAMLPLGQHVATSRQPACACSAFRAPRRVPYASHSSPMDEKLPTTRALRTTTAVALKFVYGLSVASKGTSVSTIDDTGTLVLDLRRDFGLYPNGRHTR